MDLAINKMFQCFLRVKFYNFSLQRRKTFFHCYMVLKYLQEKKNEFRAAKHEFYILK